MNTKTKILLVVSICIVVILSVIMSISFYFENYYYAEHGYKKFGEHFKTLDEVKLLYEKYDNVHISYGSNYSLSYDVFTENGSLSLEVYHNEVNLVPNQLILRCFSQYTEDYDDMSNNTNKGYFITENILDYLQNYDCFENEYP